MKEALNGYLERSREIRKLTIPPGDRTLSADQFYRILQDNFLQIRGLLTQNKEMLEQQVYAWLKQPEKLNREQAEELMEFSDNLADTGTLETVDTRLALAVIDALESYYGLHYMSSGEQEDLVKRIHCLYRQLTLCYNVALVYDRDILTQELSGKYRSRILDCADKGRVYMEEGGVFGSLPRGTQEELILMQLFRATGYERCFYSEVLVRCQIKTYEDCIKIFSRPWLRACSEEIDWEYYIFSACNFMCLIHEFLFWEKTPADILEKLDKAADYEIEYIRKHPDNRRATMEAALSSKFLISYYKGETSFEAVLQTYKDWHASRNPLSYDKINMDANLLSVASALELCGKNPQYLEQERNFLNESLEHVFQYIDGPLDSGTYETLQRYISYYLEDFIELEGGISFRQFYENLLITTQPSLYVHSRMVGRIAQCILEEAIVCQPELLLGVRGFDTVEELRKNREVISGFVLECGVLHDAGKMFYSDTINLYNRLLFQEEFKLIQFHTISGFRLLGRHTSTKEYAEAALFHHLWYNEEGGYPAGYHFEGYPDAVLYQMITCADCIDAATDSVCRAYSKGKSFDILLGELERGAGTQFNPKVVALLGHPGLREKIEELITTERRAIYHQAFFHYRNL